MIKFIFFGAAFSCVLAVSGAKRWDALMPYTTANGFDCVTPCETRDQPFYWCYTKEPSKHFTDELGNRGYCSPQAGTTFKGINCTGECHTTKPRPETHEKQWCQAVNGQQSYCSIPVEEKDAPIVRKFKTRYNSYCISKCEKAGKSYSWCHIAGGSWEYCSERPGHDIYGKKCIDACDFHGSKYTWCKVQSGGWNYCGTARVSSETEYTTVDSKCLTPCTSNSKGRNKCYDATQKSRDCSRVNGLTSRNVKCKTECSTMRGYQAYNPFYGCKVESGSWEYCSNVRSNLLEQGDLLSRSGIDVGLTRGGSLEKIFNYVDEQGRNTVTFFEAITKTGNSLQVPIERQADVEMWIQKCFENWKKEGYSVKKGTAAVQLAYGGTGKSGVRLNQQTRYTLNGEEYVSLQLQASGVDKDEALATIGEAQIMLKVLKLNPEDVVSALLRSSYEGYGVHVAQFSYTPDNSNKN